MSTLDAAQKGHLRSNSAAARMQALRKLADSNLESQDSAFLSPSIPPQPDLVKLARNNTISGGERSAARIRLLMTLGERTKGLDEGGTRGGEERPVVSMPAERRWRTPARNSASKSNHATATDGSEVLSTSTGTPTLPSSPLPYTQQPLTEPTRTASTTRIPKQPISTPNINLDENIASSRQRTPFWAVPDQWKRRGIVIERDGDVAVPPQSTYPGFPTSLRCSSPAPNQRLPHSLDAPSIESTTSATGAVGMPLYPFDRSPSKRDLSPSNPFAIPHEEVSLSSRDEEPEEVVYTAEYLRQSPYHDAFDRQISWVADPVAESNIAVHNEDEEQWHGVVEEDPDQISPELPHEESGPQTEESSPCPSSDSKELVVDIEPSLERPSAPSFKFHDSSSQTMTLNTTSLLPVGDNSDSLQRVYPQHLSVASRIQSDRSPLATGFDVDNSLITPETPQKREGSRGAWSRILDSLMRSGSSNGRRSRTSSIATRGRGKSVDSSISRRSGRSLASSTADKNELGSRYPLRGRQSVTRSSSASSSMQSLTLPTPPRRSVSPISLASNPDLTKYSQDAKLFPFPGIKELEERRINSQNRWSLSSAPDSAMSLHGNENEIPLASSSSGNTPSKSLDVKRGRVPPHRALDRDLLSKFNDLNSPPLSTSPLSLSQETSLKRRGSSGAWSRILGAVTRSGSSNGRRSRTSSIATRGRGKSADSSISRRSGGSLASSKADKNELGSIYHLRGQQSVMQSPSASSSMRSLALPTPPRRSVSPIPLASNPDLIRYNQDAKLFPFPGIKKLEEQRINGRNRRGLSVSSATPDCAVSLRGNENATPSPSGLSGNRPSNSLDMKRDRDFDHQALDTHFLFKSAKSLNSPLQPTAPSSSSHDYVSGGQTNSQSPSPVLLKTLPTNREGVRKWLSNRFGSSTPTSASDSLSPTSQTIRSAVHSKKPSLSEILRWKKENNLTSDSEGFCSPEKSRPSMSNGTLSFGKSHHEEERTATAVKQAAEAVMMAKQQAHEEMREAAREATEEEKRREEEERIGSTFPGDLSTHITRDGEFPVAAGGCADIYKGTLQAHRMAIKVAIKAIKAYSIEDNHPKKTRRLRREIKVWMKLNHANVLSLFGTTSGFGPFPAMVCPWLENGTLSSYLERCGADLEILQILALIHDVASGLQYLHSQSIVHGDLSGSNVLIDANDRACIADFGLSTVLDEIGGSTFATSYTGKPRGTLRWAAPELLDLVDHGDAKTQHTGPTIQSDVYSFGGIMLQILSGKVPYHHYSRDMQIVAAIYRGETPTRPDSPRVTDHRWKFIQRCWSPFRTIVQRPSSEEIVAFSNDDLVGNSPQAL